MSTQRRIDLAFAILAIATLLTWLLGEWWSSHTVLLPVMGGLLTLTFIKCRMVILDFMGLRPVKLFWRALMLGWAIVVLALICTAYLMGLS